MIFRKLIRLVSSVALAYVLTSCLSSSYSEGYTLVANFEYGTVLELRADSTFYTESGFSIPFNYLAFCHEIDHLNGVCFVSKATRMLDPEELEDGE